MPAAQVVERDLLPRPVVREEIGPREAGTLEVLAERRERFVTSGMSSTTRPFPPASACITRRSGSSSGSTEHPARLARLRRLLLVAAAVDPPVDVNRAAIEVDVLPHQSFELARSWKQIRREDVIRSALSRT
ncbi:hypothetical protein WME89_48380 [Sorangium sp. So ce321]|uniref:hypothetical protein n=1 Tax=Sorangium sp. So ce321 TaxID=3133300 RepID=UPI003F6330ED